jgi:hypothetical protein
LRGGRAGIHVPQPCSPTSASRPLAPGWGPGSDCARTRAVDELLYAACSRADVLRAEAAVGYARTR